MGLVENNNEVQDLVIPGLERKRFRINGDNNKILELNTSDANILKRLNVGYENLLRLADKVSSIEFSKDENSTEEQLDEMAKNLDEIDKDMREQLDEIFDSNVSEVCASNESMYSPSNGKFLWEHIIETLLNLYGDSIKKEFDLMSKRVQKHTQKYTSSSKSSRKKK